MYITQEISSLRHLPVIPYYLKLAIETDTRDLGAN